MNDTKQEYGLKVNRTWGEGQNLNRGRPGTLLIPLPYF